MSAHLNILVPVFNDWESAERLLSDLDQVFDSAGRCAAVILIDDGSERVCPEVLLQRNYSALRSITVIRLVANLGHQRAIAVGVSWLAQQSGDEAVCILDADGEDIPAHVIDLLVELEAHPEIAVVFAQRGRRTESMLVRIFYYGYKLLHRILTGFTVDIGNFSVLRRSALPALASGSSLWNHYPAAVLQSRLPLRKLRKDRGSRYAGQSKMTLHSLIIHGLSAVSVFSDRFGVRVLIGSSILSGGLFAAALLLVGSGFTRESWLLFLTLGTVLPIQLGLFFLAFVIFILSNRNAYSFIPLRDYGVFVHSVETVDVSVGSGQAGQSSI